MNAFDNIGDAGIADNTNGTTKNNKNLSSIEKLKIWARLFLECIFLFLDLTTSPTAFIKALILKLIFYCMLLIEFYVS